MPRTFIALRSVLYVPGSNTRALDKTTSLSADAFILDLEDAVSPSAKNKARENILNVLAQNNYGNKQIVIRVNPLSSHWGYDDLIAAAKTSASAVLLPKVESADMVRQAELVLSEAQAPEDLAIWCMMETPRSMLHAEEIASASSKIRAIVIGTSDLAKDLGALHTRERLPFLTSLCISIMAARAADVAIIDGVHLDLADDDGFNYSCRQGRELGFDGKTLIHPKTIEIANDIFSPSNEEITWSKKIIQAHEEASARGEGVVVVDGKLIESLHVEGARRTLLLDDAIKQLH
jgi:citrate lyase subunit beta/citryl-CoA lyase